MVKIAICDDEINVLDYITALINEQDFEASVKVYSSTADYLSDNYSFDILLLDIEMGSADNDISGMALAKIIRENQAEQPVIIFITGYEDYVYDAFDVGAFQYILKPVDEQKFSTVLSRAVKQITSERAKHNKTLEVRFAGTTRIIPIDDILYIESLNHKVIIHTSTKNVDYYDKISELEAVLQGGFYRIHKGYLVNLSHIEEYSRTEVTLSNGETLYISKHKYADFAKAHLNYIRQGDK